MSFSGGLPAGREYRLDVHEGGVARERGPADSFDRPHERQAEDRNRPPARPIEGQPRAAVRTAAARRGAASPPRGSEHREEGRRPMSGTESSSRSRSCRRMRNRDGDRVAHRCRGRLGGHARTTGRRAGRRDPSRSAALRRQRKRLSADDSRVIATASAPAAERRPAAARRRAVGLQPHQVGAPLPQRPLQLPVELDHSAAELAPAPPRCRCRRTARPHSPDHAASPGRHRAAPARGGRPAAPRSRRACGPAGRAPTRSRWSGSRRR